LTGTSIYPNWVSNLGEIIMDLAHSHTASGHELQHQAVPYFGGAEDDLVNGLFLMDLPTSQIFRPKEFLQHGRIARIGELEIEVIADEVEERFEVGIAGVFG